MRKPFLFLGLMALAVSCGRTGTPPPALLDMSGVARVEAVPSGALLTASGQSKHFTAVAYNGQGETINVPITWSSSDPAVAVGTDGNATATASVGSAQLIARAGSVKSEPALVVVALPVPGSILVDDSQVLGDPASSAGSSVGIGSRFTVELAASVSPVVGKPLLAGESKPIAGLVRSVSKRPNGSQFVELEVRPLTELMQVLDAKGTGSLRLSPASLPGLQAKSLIGAFDKITCTNTLSGSIDTGNLSVSPSVSLDFDWAVDTGPGGINRLFVRATGSAALTVSGGIKFGGGFKGEAKCRATGPSIPLPVTGFLAGLFGPQIPIGLEFVLSGEVKATVFELSAQGDIRKTFTVGFDYHPPFDYQSLNSVPDATATFTPKLVVPHEPQLRISASSSLNLTAGLEFGNPILGGLEVLRLSAGPRLEANYALEDQQAIDPNFAANYGLKFAAKVELGEDVEEGLKLILSEEQAAFVMNRIRVELAAGIPIAASPTSLTVTVDKATYRVLDDVTFRVELNPANVSFIDPFRYNVQAVQILRVLPNGVGGLTVEKVAEQTATENQTSFELHWTATVDGTSTGAMGDGKPDFFAFVVPRFMRLLPALELGAATAPTSCPPNLQFSITFLGDIYPNDMNDDGVIVGYRENANGTERAVFWKNGVIGSLPGLPGSASWEALGINSDGTIVGESAPSGNQGAHAVLWKNGVITDLHTGTDAFFSRAQSINDHDQIVGTYGDDNDYHAVMWLGTLGVPPISIADGLSQALHVNNRGDILGLRSPNITDRRAFLIHEGVLQDLPSLGGDTEGFGLNNLGAIAGVSAPSSAVLWRAGSITVLPSVGDLSAGARDVNDDGLIVGSAGKEGSPSVPVIWRGGVITSLAPLVTNLSESLTGAALLVNNKCQIAGVTDHNGQTSGFLLTPLAH